MRIVSGGQTGVDRGALNAAIELKIPHGGWCPRGRRAEDGAIPANYQLEELPSASYAARTERNVLDSDGTLILCRGRLMGGTALTRRLARRHARPCLRIRLPELAAGNGQPAAQKLLDRAAAWIVEHRIHTLNVAGPRESQAPGIEQQAAAFLRLLLARVAQT
jgi:hypothetical protein